MTIFLATNWAGAADNPSGLIGSAAGGSTFDSAYSDASFTMAGRSVLDFWLGAVRAEAWFHFNYVVSGTPTTTTGKLVGGFNNSRRGYDFYIEVLGGAVFNPAQFYYWNGSSMVAVGPVWNISQSTVHEDYDLHFVKDAVNGSLAFYQQGELVAEVTGIDTSNFDTDYIRVASVGTFSDNWSQIVAADVCTIGWRAFAPNLQVPTDGITFVGQAFQALAGAASGTTTIALNSGLTGGIASAVSPDDYVVAVFAVGSTVDRTLSITDGTNPYALLGSELYINDTFDANLRVAIKKMGVVPDTSVTFGNTGSVDDAGVIGVYVLRNVDLTTFNDVAVATATTANGSYPNPPSLTPVTQGSIVLVVGAAAHDGVVVGLDNPDSLLDRVYQGGPGLNDVSVVIGHFPEWVSGSVDPGAMTNANTASTHSSAALTVAVRPTLLASTFTRAGVVADVAVDAIRLDNSFIGSETVDQSSIYSIENLPTTNAEVKAVVVNAVARPGETGPQGINGQLRIDGTVFNGSDVALGVGGGILTKVWDQNPDTLAAWTQAEANSVLLGVRSRT